jgi:hypothetical protein
VAVTVALPPDGDGDAMSCTVATLQSLCFSAALLHTSTTMTHGLPPWHV